MRTGLALPLRSLRFTVAVTVPVTPPPKPRLDFIDAMRGVAVILMILWHTTDSWLTDASRAVNGHETTAYSVLRLLGGTAAPLFLLLAGVAHGLKASANARKGTAPLVAMREAAARGLELIVMGYLLRLQFFAVDAAGVRLPQALLPLLFGLLLLLIATKRLATAPPRAGLFAAAGAVLYAVGLVVLAHYQPSRIASVLRVDVLQAIGASLVVLALLEPLLTRAPAIALGLAFGVTLATDPLTALMPGALPEPLAAYVARWTVPQGVRTMAMFPLFPWLAFPLIGSVLGRHWSAGARRGTLGRDVAILSAVGVIGSFVANESLAYELGWIWKLPWFIPTLRILARVALCLVFGGLCFAGLALSARVGFGQSKRAEHYAPIRTLGRASLFVYWVHLELAFGLIATPLKRKVDLAEWALGFVLLTVAMYLLVLLKNGPATNLARSLAQRVRPSRDNPASQPPS